MRINEHYRDLIIGTLIIALISLCIIVAANSWGSNEINYNKRNHQGVIQEILRLESGYKNIPCAYSDTCTEIGVAQFKPTTWALFQKKSGMYHLSIYEASDQVHMLDWAIRNGLGSHWTTYRTAQENSVMKRYIVLRSK